MNRILTTSLIGAAAAAALVAGTCAPAFADGTSTPAPKAGKTLASIQAEAKIKTTARTGALNTAIAKVTAAPDITSADRSTILATLNGDLAGMNTVEAKIAADTTVATAAADYKTIFTSYRVYAVAIPQSRYAAGADRMTGTTIPKLTDAQTKLAAALAGPDASKSTPALQADLADMKNQIDAATTALDGVAAKSLAVTPADFNSNHSVMQPIRASAKAALADLKKAAADGKTILGGDQVIESRKLRITAAVISVAVIGGALAGCSRVHQPPTPAAVTSTVAPTPGVAAGDSSLSSIQDDLNAANSSTANADGDVSAGDSAAATNDNQ